MRIFISRFDYIERQQLKMLLYQLRCKANMQNPPRHQAARAIGAQDLIKLQRIVETEKATKLEELLVEVLIIAFATMSHVAEIVLLTETK